jgi:hypothetical protein
MPHPTSGYDAMLWFVMALAFSTRLELVPLGRLSEREKEWAIRMLRHQLDILE